MAQCILTDIEGTTSSISFVRDVLFPYAARALPDHIRRHREHPEVAAQVAAIRVLMDHEASLEEIIVQLLEWIERDAKVTPLKALQGMVWVHGYQSGAYRAHVYPDAYVALQAWRAAQIPLYVYSSGSVQAQKLFFGHTEYGDLTDLFAGYFDTTSGPKKETSSYARIATAIGQPAGDILFLSDVPDELRAARAAGMQTCWLVRPADTSASPAEVAAGEFPVARGFSEISLAPAQP